MSISDYREKIFLFIIKENDLEMLEWFCGTQNYYPRRGKFIDEAVKNKGYEIIKWLRSPEKFHKNRVCPWGWFSIANAARRGYLDMIKWLRNPDNDPQGNPCPFMHRSHIVQQAVAGGHKDVLEWLAENIETNGCDPLIYFESIRQSIFFGKLDLTKWSREKYIHSRKKIGDSEKEPFFDEHVLDQAKKNKHPDIIAWAESLITNK